ncbi:hypothetical protein MIND_01153900 [Mycena indigotica]|uniref:Uncharacterized protein n=1 Tax=Mycena indigotica TaxID=2126181 RepID=A0A8H6S4C3_9AGAR|nr:uncharacterized protein MIND_01153900 [Mycena indigotica]KAF7292566.1 hypothetical protein MIND_01153900 [Mycena indigotica]
MFFRASIAFALIAASSLSLTAVFSAPVAAPNSVVGFEARAAAADFVPLACARPNLQGNCIALGTTKGDGPGTCTNLIFEAKSLRLNLNNDCVSFPGRDCKLDFDKGESAVEHFSNDADINDLKLKIVSVSCQSIPGLVNGLFPQ